MDMKDKKCQVCNINLKNTDEIVVCPECGAPYHRSCYLNQGSCVYKEKHSKNFVWNSENSGSPAGKKICNRCASENDKNAERCIVCGYSDFSYERQNSDNYARNNQRHTVNFTGNVEDGLPPLFRNVNSAHSFFIPIDTLGGVSPEEKIDGEIAADVASCVKVNTIYYLPRFKRMSQDESKISMNWAAVIFGPFWYLLRKCYLQGLCSFLIMLALYFVATFEVTRIYEVLNIASESWYTNQGSLILMEKLRDASNIELITPYILIYIAAFILMILNNIIWGCLGNYLYRKNIISRIHWVNEKVKTNNFSLQEKVDLLESKSGINIFLPILAYFILQFVVMFV